MELVSSRWQARRRIALSGQSIDRRASQERPDRRKVLEVCSPTISDSLTLAAIGIVILGPMVEGSGAGSHRRRPGAE